MKAMVAGMWTMAYVLNISVVTVKANSQEREHSLVEKDQEPLSVYDETLQSEFNVDI